jgi:hypothetical protein
VSKIHCYQICSSLQGTIRTETILTWMITQRYGRVIKIPLPYY